jgi:hypothetical protein
VGLFPSKSPLRFRSDPGRFHAIVSREYLDDEHSPNTKYIESEAYNIQTMLTRERSDLGEMVSSLTLTTFFTDLISLSPQTNHPEVVV